MDVLYEVMKIHRALRILAAGVIAFGGTIDSGRAQGIPGKVRQLLVSVAPGWDTSQGVLRLYERPDASVPWRPAGDGNIPVLYGRNGLAWGLGILPVPSGLSKKEKDGRAPAGCFAIGTVYGYAGKLPKGSDFRYRQVSEWDAWPDDPQNPFYNQHVVIDPKQGIPEWFQKQKMRHGDPAYAWLVEIRHNSGPIRPGAGSAIFMHIRRGANRPSAGCTTMEEDNLVQVIRWLRTDMNPHYVLLPRKEYERLQVSWGLPAFP